MGYKNWQPCQLQLTYNSVLQHFNNYVSLHQLHQLKQQERHTCSLKQQKQMRTSLLIVYPTIFLVSYLNHHQVYHYQSLLPIKFVVRYPHLFAPRFLTTFQYTRQIYQVGTICFDGSSFYSWNHDNNNAELNATDRKSSNQDLCNNKKKSCTAWTAWSTIHDTSCRVDGKLDLPTPQHLPPFMVTSNDMTLMVHPHLIHLIQVLQMETEPDYESSKWSFCW